jgi:hypothetical protein
MDTRTINNSLEYGPVAFQVVLVSLAVIIAEIWIFIDYTDSFTRTSGIIIGVVLWIIFFYAFGLKIYYLNRPKSVEISDDGVKLNMRLGKKPIIIAWPDIWMIGFTTSLLGKKEGEILNDIAWYYPIDHSIALELKEAYYQRMGKYPPKSYDELCPGMERDRLVMSPGQWNKKYERFKKKN